MSKFVTGKKASEALGLTQNTLRKLADDGKLPHIVLPSGHRRYDVEGYVDASASNGPKAKIVYARVSSSQQKDDMRRQVDMLRENYPGYEVVEDVGSGINFRRKGLRSVLERSMRGDVGVVVVAHRDRLARFAFDLVEWILRSNGVELVVHEPTVDTPEKELVDDLLSIVTVFACRAYGRRKYGKRKRPDGEEGEKEAGGEQVPPCADLP